MTSDTITIHLPDDSALRALAEWGVDLSLIRATLELTPTERLERMVDLLAVGEALHLSYLRRSERGACAIAPPMDSRIHQPLIARMADNV